MKKIDVSASGYEVIASGESFLFAPDGDLTLRIEEVGAYRLALVFKFVQKDGCDATIRFHQENDTLVLDCVNFTESSRGTVNPVKIASIEKKTEKKDVYLHFWAYLDGAEKQIRRVKYTLFTKEPS